MKISLEGSVPEIQQFVATSLRGKGQIAMSISSVGTSFLTDGVTATGSSGVVYVSHPKRYSGKRTMSSAARKNMRIAQQKRWAKVRKDNK